MNNDNNDNDNDNDVTFADSDFLAQRDLAVNDFRMSEKESKCKIITKMLTLRHNMKYNKHLLSVYMKAKGIFDTMVEEHRSQLYYLDEIYRHINQLIRENLSTISKKPNGIMTELIKDKKRIGNLLKKMRISYEKLMNIDTVIGVTIDNMNEITFIDDDAQHVEEDDDGDSELEEVEADDDVEDDVEDDAEDDTDSYHDEDDDDSYIELDEPEDDSDDSEADDSEADDSEADDSEEDEDDDETIGEPAIMN
jgi:hypothetical protein